MTKRVFAIGALVVVFAATAAVAVALWQGRGDDGDDQASAAPRAHNARRDATERPRIAPSVDSERRKVVPAVDTEFALEPVSAPLPVTLHMKHPPAAGVLFDIDSGEVLWQRHPSAQRPIASLTKMMTALLIAERDPPTDSVPISVKASQTPGSATGLLPRGHKVPLQPLLDALIMISANDAAVALAEHDSGTVTRFVKRMNERAKLMGLTCTHFSTPNGLKDRDNHSCALDLAALARADLANPRIARIAQTRYAKPHFPIKGDHLHLANNHYFLYHGLDGVPGARVTGLKTGETDGAGRCYVTTAALGGHRLGVVLLDSPNPFRQVPALLAAGFREVGAS